MTTSTMGRLGLHYHDGVLTLTGVLDEASQFVAVAETIAPPRLTLDSAALTMINSLGIRDWVRFIDRLRQRAIAVDLVNTAEALITQLGIIVAARGHAQVLSFYAPYTCDGCGSETSELIDAVAERANLIRGEAPVRRCPSCHTDTLVFNDFPERYFAFLAGA